MFPSSMRIFRRRRYFHVSAFALSGVLRRAGVKDGRRIGAKFKGRGMAAIKSETADKKTLEFFVKIRDNKQKCNMVCRTQPGTKEDSK